MIKRHKPFKTSHIEWCPYIKVCLLYIAISKLSWAVTSISTSLERTIKLLTFSGGTNTNLVVHGKCAAVRNAVALVICAAGAGTVDILLGAGIHGEVTLCVADVGSDHARKSKSEQCGRKELHIGWRAGDFSRISFPLLGEEEVDVQVRMRISDNRRDNRLSLFGLLMNLYSSDGIGLLAAHPLCAFT